LLGRLEPEGATNTKRLEKKLLNYWLVIHSLASYSIHNNLIGCSVKRKGLPKPSFEQFAHIQKGDKVIYYAAKDQVVVGIFDITSDMIHLSNDPVWKEMAVFKIEPFEMPPRDFYVNFSKALADSNTKLDLFPNSSCWYSYLQGKTVRKLTKHDYLIIMSWLKKSEYLIKNSDIKTS
jgi:hypothetical protein